MTGARPELILFDAGGTLVLIDPDRFNAFISGWDLPAVTNDLLFTAHFRAMSDFSHRLGDGDTARDAWYVGDSPYHDIGGARAAGLAAAVLIDPLALGAHDQLSVMSIAELPDLFA